MIHQSTSKRLKLGQYLQVGLNLVIGGVENLGDPPRVLVLGERDRQVPDGTLADVLHAAAGSCSQILYLAADHGRTESGLDVPCRNHAFVDSKTESFVAEHQFS
jgi:hypothetical protein